MKYMLNASDRITSYTLPELICDFMRHHHRDPEYIIVHPDTWNQVIMCSNERADDFRYERLHLVPDENSNKGYRTQSSSIMGISFLRSFDIEPGFVIMA